MGRGKGKTFLGSQGGEQWGHGEEHTPVHQQITTFLVSFGLQSFFLFL